MSLWGFPCGSAGKKSTCGRPGFDPWVGKIPWRRERLPTLVFWPGESHGLYSPWRLSVGHDWATFTFTYLYDTPWGFRRQCIYICMCSISWLFGTLIVFKNLCFCFISGNKSMCVHPDMSIFFSMFLIIFWEVSPYIKVKAILFLFSLSFYSFWNLFSCMKWGIDIQF